MTRISICCLGCLEKAPSRTAVLSINYRLHENKARWTMVLILTAVALIQS